jgi:hypothetical protein
MKILLLFLALVFSVTAQKPKPTPFVFTEAATVVPSDYKGNTPAELSRTISEYQNPNQEPAKGEFEKTVDYQKRIEEWRKTRKPISLRKYILAAGSTNYDADTEILTVSTESPIIMETRNEESTYEAQNGLGAKVTVKKTHTAAYALQIEGSADVEISIPPAEAQKLKPQIRILLIVDLAPPFSTIQMLPKKDATFFEPTETTGSLVTYFATLRGVWVMDNRTGKVLAKKPTQNNP